MERASAPLTPVTGGKENSGIGLFFYPRDSGTEAIILVSSNDPTYFASTEQRIKSLGSKFDKTGIYVEWLSRSDAPTWETSSTIMGTLFHLRLVGKEEGSEEETLVLELGGIVPTNVVIGWAQHIIDENIRHLSLLFMDSTTASLKENKDGRNFFGELELDSCVSWTLDDEFMESKAADLAKMENLEVKDQYFGDSYTKNPLYLDVAGLKEKDSALKKEGETSE